MKSIKQLLIEINLKEKRQREFDAFNILDDNCQELLNRVKAIEAKNLKYYVSVTHDAAQTLNIVSPTILVFNTTIYPQYGNMHDNVNDNDKIFIRRNGVYHIAGGIHAPQPGASGFITVSIILNRNGVATAIAGQRIDGRVEVVSCVARSYYLYTNDYLQLRVDYASFTEVSGDAYTFMSVAERLEDLDPSQYGLLPPIEGK